MVAVPQFTMGANILPSFMQGSQGVANALGQWQARNLKQQQLEQQQAQFLAQNALAQSQFGLQQQAQARADTLQPYQIAQMQANTNRLDRAGAADAQLMPLKIQHYQAQTDYEKARADYFRNRAQPQAAPVEPVVGQRADGTFYEIPAEMNAQMSGAPRVESRVLGDSTSVPATTQREHLDFGQYGMKTGNIPGIVTNQGGGSDRYATEVYQGQRAVSSMPDADRDRYLEFERIQKRGHRLAGKPKQGFVYDKYLRQVPSGSLSASADAQERKDRAIGFMMDQIGEAEKVMIESGNLTRSLAAGLKDGGIPGRLVSNTLGLEKVGAAFDKYKEGVMQTVYALSGKQTTNKEMQNFLDLFMPQAGESTWLIKDKTKRLNTMLSTLRSKVKTGMLFDDAMSDAIANAGAPGSGRGSGQKRDLSKMSTDELLRSLNGR